MKTNGDLADPAILELLVKMLSIEACSQASKIGAERHNTYSDVRE